MMLSPLVAVVVWLVLILDTTATAQSASSNATFRFIVIPDTQNYSWNLSTSEGGRGQKTFLLPEGTAQIFKNMTQWIADNKDELNIKFVTQLGDLVHHGYNTTEWKIADEAMQVLDDAGIPYGTTIGNHDDDFFYVVKNVTVWYASAENYLKYFGPHRHENEPWYGGHSPSNLSSYQLVEHDEMKFLFLHLGLGAAAPNVTNNVEEVKWADGVLYNHTDRVVFVSTHIHTVDLRLSVGRYRENFKMGLLRGIDPFKEDFNEEGVVSPEELYQTFVQRHANIAMIFSGHFCSSVYRDDSFNGADLPVFEVLQDFSCSMNGGNGYFHIFEVDVANNQIHSSIYSPFQGRHRTVIENFVEDIEIIPNQVVSEGGFDDDLTKEFVESALLGIMKGDLVKFHDIIAEHPDYLADPNYYDELFRTQFKDTNQTSVPLGYGNFSTEYEALWLAVFANNPAKWWDVSPSKRSPNYTLTVNFQDYITKPVLKSKSIHRIYSELWRNIQGKWLKWKQIYMLKIPPYLVDVSEEPVSLVDFIHHFIHQLLERV